MKLRCALRLALALPALLAGPGCGGSTPEASGAKGASAQASTNDERGESAPIPQSGIPREAWPESWFEPPRTASELGIESFRQSPVLDAQVASGELPPVEERLPDDPIVVEPFERIGVHGGTEPPQSV